MLAYPLILDREDMRQRFTASPIGQEPRHKGGIGALLSHDRGFVGTVKRVAYADIAYTQQGVTALEEMTAEGDNIAAQSSI